MNMRRMTAPCGLDCFNCQMHEKNITEEMRKGLAAMLKKSPDQVACKGCRDQNGCPLYPGSCDTLECARAKGVEFCHECSDFPCAKLAPSASGAEKYPHNLKVYNLCQMKALGFEEWAEKHSMKNRALYYKGQFIPGKGPVL